MAITIVKRPERYTPSSNPIIYQISTDNSDIVFFQVRLLEDDSTTVINDLQIYPTPALPQGSYIDFSRLLDDVVRHEVNNDPLTLASLSDPVRAYRFRITERIYNATTGELENGDAYDEISDVNYVFHAGLSRGAFRSYDDSDWVINTSGAVSFLTDKPDNVRVNRLSAEHLYFLQDGSVSGLKLRIRLYSAQNALLSTITNTLASTSTYRMYRANISPKVIAYENGVNFANVHHYVVDVIDGSGVVKVTGRTYYYEAVECHLEYVNLLWQNPYGGLDSYQWVAPQETNNHTRFQIKKNIYNVNSAGYYADTNNDILYPSDVVLNNRVAANVKVTSKELSDAEAYWLQGLFATKQLYVELEDTTLVPALLINTTYDIPRLRYNRGKLNTIQVEFTFTEGFWDDPTFILTDSTPEFTTVVAPTPTPTITPTITPSPTSTPGLTPSASVTPTPTPTPVESDSALDVNEYYVYMDAIMGTCDAQAQGRRSEQAAESHVAGSGNIIVTVTFEGDNGCQDIYTFRFLPGETESIEYDLVRLDCNGPCSGIFYYIDSVEYQ